RLDLGDLDRGVVLAMPVATDVVLAAAELEDHELLAAAVLDDLPGDLGAGDQRLADVDGRAVPRGDQQDLVEHHGRALFTGELLVHHGLAGLDPVLLATRLDHGVHDLLHENAFGIADFTDRRPIVKPPRRRRSSRGSTPLDHSGFARSRERYRPSRFRNSSAVSAGFARPCVSFMTWPTKNPNTASLP